MTFLETLEAARTGATVLAAIFAGYVAWRAGVWRGADKSSAATKEMETRVSSMEQRVSNLEQEAIAMDVKEMPERVSRLERSVVSIETRLDNMPTRADVEGMRSELRALDRGQNRVEGLVNQIHTYLLEKAR
jgi:phage shock protein A